MVPRLCLTAGPRLSGASCCRPELQQKCLPGTPPAVLEQDGPLCLQTPAPPSQPAASLAVSPRKQDHAGEKELTSPKPRLSPCVPRTSVPPLLSGRSDEEQGDSSLPGASLETVVSSAQESTERETSGTARSQAQTPHAHSSHTWGRSCSGKWRKRVSFTNNGAQMDRHMEQHRLELRAIPH